MPAWRPQEAEPHRNIYENILALAGVFYITERGECDKREREGIGYTVKQVRDMKNGTGLDTLLPGQVAVVKTLNSNGALRGRLLDMGIMEGTRVECLGVSPGGDPHAFLVRGTVLAIRCRDSREIIIKEED